VRLLCLSLLLDYYHMVVLLLDYYHMVVLLLDYWCCCWTTSVAAGLLLALH
jgi:hypothetical protein